MKRRNREQRARMRTIQENHMTKPYQRAMDLVQRKTGLSYRIIYRSYQIGARPGSTNIDLTTFKISNIRKMEHGTYEFELCDTGKPVGQLSHLSFEARPVNCEEE